MANRQGLSRKIRFEVFKRDSFTCQYCGSKAPDVVLQVDHITPVAAGGSNDFLNLVTSCQPCNSGKSDRVLTASHSVTRRRSELEFLEERRQQLQMLYDWHLSLLKVDDDAVDLAQSLWFSSIAEDGCILTEPARNELRKLIKRHGFDLVLEGIAQAADAAMRSPHVIEHKNSTTNSWFWKIASVIAVTKQDRDDPGTQRLFYIRGILRNRCYYLNEAWCIELLRDAKHAGVCIEWMHSLAKSVRSWSSFRDAVYQAILDVESAGHEEAD